MFARFARLFSHTASTPATTGRFRPTLNTLEDRTTPSISSLLGHLDAAIGNTLHTVRQVLAPPSGTPPAQPSPAPAQQATSLSGVVQDGSGNAQAGVQVTLNGTTSQGQSVTITVVTDANGAYSFTNLQAGTYTLTEQPPEAPSGYSYANTQDYSGQINGQGTATITSGTTTPSITLNSGDVGTQYNFINNYELLG
jgi:hypothetical protein